MCALVRVQIDSICTYSIALNVDVCSLTGACAVPVQAPMHPRCRLRVASVIVGEVVIVVVVMHSHALATVEE